MTSQLRVLIFCWDRQLIRHRTEYNLTCLVFTLCLVHLSLDNFVSSWQLHWKLPTGLSIWKPGNVLHLQYPLLCLSLADQHQGIFKQMGVNLEFSHFVYIEGEWKVWTVLRFYKLAQVGKSGGLIRPQNFLAHTHSFWQNLDNLYYEPCSLLPIETRHAVCVWGQNWLFSILGESSLWCVEKRNIIWALLGSKSKFWDHTVLSAAEATTFNSEKFLKSEV